MKFFSSLCGLVIALLALSFALTNRESVTVSLWPFDIKAEAPLYLMTLGTLFFGLLLGSLFAWFTMLPHHFEARRLRSDIGKLHDQLAELQQSITPAPHMDAGYLPAPKRRRFWERRL